jgi:hypothetical protein
MQITLSNGTTIVSTAAPSTAALIISQAFNIPLDDSLSSPDAAKDFAVKLIGSIGQPWFDESVARAIVQVFPDIDRSLAWYQDLSKSVPHSISGLPVQDLMTIAFTVVSEGTKAMQSIDVGTLQESISNPKKPAKSPLKEAAEPAKEEKPDTRPDLAILSLTAAELVEYQLWSALQGHEIPKPEGRNPNGTWSVFTPSYLFHAYEFAARQTAGQGFKPE